MAKQGGISLLFFTHTRGREGLLAQHQLSFPLELEIGGQKEKESDRHNDRHPDSLSSWPRNDNHASGCLDLKRRGTLSVEK